MARRGAILRIHHRNSVQLEYHHSTAPRDRNQEKFLSGQEMNAWRVDKRDIQGIASE
jgi:hypothetical protein